MNGTARDDRPNSGLSGRRWCHATLKEPHVPHVRGQIWEIRLKARWGDDARERESGSRDLSRGGRSGADSRERERERVEPREVFAGHVALPRGQEREHVWVREHSHMLRGSESRTLAAVGSFRVIPADDLRDAFDKPLDPRHGDLWHLREAGLVQTHRVDRD